MVGLRTQEGVKFERFFDIVQKKAKSLRKVFFLDCGEGSHMFEDDNLECEDLIGWLIPAEEANEFEKQFLEFNDSDDWADFLAVVEWEFFQDNINVKISML